MATNAFSTGTQTAVIGTEHFVADVNLAGVYSFSVDMDAMVAGDIVELAIYEMVLTSGTAREVARFPFYGVDGGGPGGPVKLSKPVGNELTDSQALRFSLKQTFGTGRAFPWKVLRYA